MKRFIPAFLFCGMFTLLGAIGCDSGAKEADMKVDPATLEIKQGESKDVKVTGKDPKAEVSPAVEGVKAVVAGEKLTVSATDTAKEGEATVKVTGKGKETTLKVTVKKK